ncbi:hypothetical protein [uncultured Serinicoccus sp.]|uniref:hypothetical protein n=1 Tax=uncultured Serinicoccus sp. TaxID=735514 RepID=UPI00262E1CBB|nr:hypothetical protein [uncultured Serinicoccus sp.]
MNELARRDRDAREVVDVVTEARAALLSARDELGQLQDAVSTAVQVLADVEWAQRQAGLAEARPRDRVQLGQRVQDLARTCVEAAQTGRDAGRAVVRVRAALQAAGVLVEGWSSGSTQERVDRTALRGRARELTTALNEVETSLEQTVNSLGRAALSAREAGPAQQGTGRVEAPAEVWRQSLRGATVSTQEAGDRLDVVAEGTQRIGRQMDGVAAAARARMEAARRIAEPALARTTGVAR